MVAASEEHLQLHHRIRHQVFVEEQRLFDGTDVDVHDGHGATLRVLGMSESGPVGTVRLFPLDGPARQWQGDRLAVLPPFRALGVGKPLVRFAVATAGTLGGEEMVAHIQLPNVAFFEHLGWHRNGPVETYVGVPHQPMAIPLRS